MGNSESSRSGDADEYSRIMQMAEQQGDFDAHNARLNLQNAVGDVNTWLGEISAVVARYQPEFAPAPTPPFPAIVVRLRSAQDSMLPIYVLLQRCEGVVVDLIDSPYDAPDAAFDFILMQLMALSEFGLHHIVIPTAQRPAGALAVMAAARAYIFAGALRASGPGAVMRSLAIQQGIRPTPSPLPSGWKMLVTPEQITFAFVFEASMAPLLPAPVAPKTTTPVK